MRGKQIKLYLGLMPAGELAQHHLSTRRGKLAMGSKLLYLSLLINL
jgi:hypothetical protein